MPKVTTKCYKGYSLKKKKRFMDCVLLMTIMRSIFKGHLDNKHAFI